MYFRTKIRCTLANTAAIILILNTTITRADQNKQAGEGNKNFTPNNGEFEIEFKNTEDNLSYRNITELLEEARQEAIAGENGVSIRDIFKLRIKERQNDDSSDNKQLPSTTEDSLSPDGKETGEIKETVFDNSNADYSKKSGQFQCKLGGKTTEEILKEPCLNGGRNVSDDYLNIAKQLAGSYVENRVFPIYNVPYYTQSGAEAWTGRLTLGKSSGYGDDLSSVGCAFYMGAHIFSVLEGKVINPAEMHPLYHHYGVVDTSGNFIDSPTGLNSMLNTIGYKIEFYSVSQCRSDNTIKSKLDQNLKEGIPQGYRVHSGTFASGPNHFMNIDAIKDDKYLVAQSCSYSHSQQGYTWEQILNNMQSDGHYGLYIISKK